MSEPPRATDIEQEMEEEIARQAAADTPEVIDSETLSRMLIEHLKNPSNESKEAIPTGFPALDDLLCGGMRKKGVYLIAAHTSVGKSALVLQIADYVAEHTGNVLYVSLERDFSTLMQRRVARESHVAITGMTGKPLSDADQNKITDAITKLSETPLYCNASLPATVAQVGVAARTVKDLKLLVVDYLGLLGTQKRCSSSYERLSVISNELKALAAILDVPILCTARMLPTGEPHQSAMPELAELQATGVDVQNTEAVLLLYRKNWNQADSKAHANSASSAEVCCYLDFNRHGKQGRFTLLFHKPTYRFEQIERGFATLT